MNCLHQYFQLKLQTVLDFRVGFLLGPNIFNFLNNLLAMFIQTFRLPPAECLLYIFFH